MLKNLVVIMTILMFFKSAPVEGINIDKISDKEKISDFQVKKSASENDWKYFFAASANWRFSLWSYQKKLGVSFEDWHWTWRIGWIKSCKRAEDIQLKHCQKIIEKGAKDNALVVRSETVTFLSEVHAGSKDQKIVKILENIFRDERNIRNGKPLYIQKQIVYALKNIGGQRASKAAEELATKYAETKRYLKSIDKGQ